MPISNLGNGLRTGVCTSTNRPTTPYEGQHIYETDTDIEYVWSGTAWVVNYVSAASPTFTGTPLAPTATTGTNTTQLATTAFANAAGGLVYVTGGALSSTVVDFVGCFTSEYRDYRIVIDSISWNAAGDLYYQMLSGTTPATAGDYYWAMRGIKATLVAYDSSASAQALGYLGSTNNGANNLVVGSCSWDICGPQLAQRTLLTGQGIGVATDFFGLSGMNSHNLTNAYTGIRLLTNSATTFTGNVSIYGYRKA